MCSGASGMLIEKRNEPRKWAHLVQRVWWMKCNSHAHDKDGMPAPGINMPLSRGVNCYGHKGKDVWPRPCSIGAPSSRATSTRKYVPPLYFLKYRLPLCSKERPTKLQGQNVALGMQPWHLCTTVRVKESFHEGPYAETGDSQSLVIRPSQRA